MNDPVTLDLTLDEIHTVIAEDLGLPPPSQEVIEIPADDEQPDEQEF